MRRYQPRVELDAVRGSEVARDQAGAATFLRPAKLLFAAPSSVAGVPRRKVEDCPMLAGSLLLVAGLFPVPPAAGATGSQEARSLAPAGSTMGADRPALKPEELDQMLAPIALHPDDLLSQILMAATYPIEVVQADRWVKANPKLAGDALAKELEKQTWDPSVRSLVNFPQVLAMMSEKLDWTVNLGNAFLGQQKKVMDAIQKLRAKAKEAGNLESTKEQKVTTET
jgi:hypothetical protein